VSRSGGNQAKGVDKRSRRFNTLTAGQVRSSEFDKLVAVVLAVLALAFSLIHPSVFPSPMSYHQRPPSSSRPASAMNPWRGAIPSWQDSQQLILLGKSCGVFAARCLTPTLALQPPARYEELYGVPRAWRRSDRLCVGKRCFVMFKVGPERGRQNVFLLPMATADFPAKMGMLVEESNLGLWSAFLRYFDGG